MGIELLEGRLPENSHEILLSEHTIKDGGLNKNVGDTITLNLGKRYSRDENGEYELTQSNPFVVEESEDNLEEPESREYLKLESEKTYTIVGVMKRPSSTIESYEAPGYTCITYKENVIDKKSAAIIFKNPRHYSKKTENIVGKKYDYKYNSELLRYLGVTESGMMNALYVVAIVVISIIIISSIFVIKNSFAISITEKYKMYGMLRSVGSTSKQIKKNVLFEGFILGLIAIPLGILLGILAIVILIFLMNFILADSLNNMKFVYDTPIFPILLSILLASITIYFSTVFTAKRAAKITAIEAIRGNQDIKIKRKKLKTPKIIHKLFKMGGVIAYKNLKRNKKKYRTTVISIAISVFIFISLSSFIDFGFKMTGLYYSELSYNMAIYSSLEEKEMQELFEKLKSNSGVERSSYLRLGVLNLDAKKYGSDFGRKILDSYGYDEDNTMNINVYAVGEEEYKDYLNDLGLHNENIKNKGILIDEYQEVINKKTHVGNLYNVKNNDIITGVTKPFSDSKDEKEFSIEIIRSNKRPMGLEQFYSEGGFLIVSDKMLEENFDIKPGSIYLKTNDTDSLENYLENLMKENTTYKDLNYNNMDDYRKEMNSMVLIVSIFFYGFITVISLIGITNIFNTITTNMNLRSKEFAMLKSVGMTKKEFNRMIRLESIFYGTKALLFGIPLGLAGSLIIYKAFTNGLDFGYMLPLKAIIISVVFVAVIIGIIMKYSLQKINKQNIMETIRNENI